MKFTIYQGAYNPKIDFKLDGSFATPAQSLPKDSKDAKVESSTPKARLFPKLCIELEASELETIVGSIDREIEAEKSGVDIRAYFFLIRLKNHCLSKSQQIIFDLFSFIGTTTDRVELYAPIHLAYLYGVNSNLNKLLKCLSTPSDLKAAPLVLFREDSAIDDSERERFKIRQSIMTELIIHLRNNRSYYENAGVVFSDYDQQLEPILDSGLTRSQTEVCSFVQNIPTASTWFFHYLPREVINLTLGFVKPEISTEFFGSYCAGSSRRVMENVLANVTGGFEYEGVYYENLIAKNSSNQAGKVAPGLARLTEAGALRFSEVDYKNPLWFPDRADPLKLIPYSNFFIITHCNAELLKTLRPPARGTYLNLNLHRGAPKNKV